MNAEKARELAFHILEEFEDMLASKGILIPSEDREGWPEEACIYGTEYYLLEDAITELLVKATRLVRRKGRRAKG
jgi:hypothetical protein